MIIRACDDILPVHFPCPPAKGAHAAFDGAGGDIGLQPVPDQCFNMLGFEGMTVHAPIADFVQLVRDQRELALALYLCSIAPFPVMSAELLQLVVQASQ